MLDKRTEMMLQVAHTLTADDLDAMRGTATVTSSPTASGSFDSAVGVGSADAPEAIDALREPPEAVGSPGIVTLPQTSHACGTTSRSSVPRGEYERQRTRESKVSTVCIGRERDKHDWWPVGTELEGRIGSDTFTATVVENAQVKSSRSLLITSGPAAGRVCITPTRAAIEATEEYRRSRNLGRAGGVTNGWEFWRAIGPAH